MFGAELELALGRPVEHVAGAPLELGSRGNVMPQRRPGQKERAFAIEQSGIEGRNRAALSAEERQQTAGVQTIEAAIESGLAY